MSQYPSPTTLENGNIASGVQRQSAPNANLPGVTQQLNAPGVVPLPPVSATANLLGQAMDTAATVGQGFAAYHRYLDEQATQARMNASDQRRMEADAEHAKALVVGEGVRFAESKLADFKQQLDSGAIARDPNQSIEDAARSYLDKISAGHDSSFVEGVQRHVSTFSGAILDHERGLGNIQASDLITSAQRSAITSPDAQGMLSAVNAMSMVRVNGLPLSQEHIYSNTLVPALMDAARTNQPDRVAMIEDLLPKGMFQDKVDQAHLELSAAQNQVTEKANHSAIESVGDYMLGYHSGDDNKTLAGGLDLVKQLRDSGAVEPSVLEHLQNQILSEKRQAEKLAEEERAAQAFDGARVALLQNLVAVGENGDLGPALSSIPTEGFKVQVGKVTKTLMGRSEALDLVVQNKFMDINRQIPPDKNYNANFAAKLKYVAQNPELTSPELKQTFAGVASRVTAGMAEADVPPMAVKALNDFRNGMVMDQGATLRHATGPDLEYLRVANLAADIPGMTLQKALILTSEKMRSPPGLQDMLTERLSNASMKSKVASSIPDAATATNGETALAMVEQRARAYKMLLHVPEEKAVDRSIEDFKADYTNINGFFVKTRGYFDANQSAALPDIGKSIIDRWASAEPGRDASKVSFAPDEMTHTWRIRNFDSSVPVNDSPVFSDQDLKQIAGSITAMERAKSDHQRQIEGFITKQMQPGGAGAPIIPPNDHLEEGGQRLVSPLTDWLTRYFAREDVGKTIKFVPPTPEESASPAAQSMIEYMNKPQKPGVMPIPKFPQFRKKA